MMILAAAVGLTLAVQTPLPVDVRVDTVARGLVHPWGMGFLPDGRMLLVERPGRIRVFEAWGWLDTEPWATIDVGQGGALMGLAVAPDFAQSGAVFVTAAVFGPDSSWTNRVLRLVERDRRGQGMTVVVDRIPSNRIHHGSAVAFGPDGMLYVTTGDAMEPAHAQNLQSLGGKLLRFLPDGRVPRDNPNPSSPVWAYGLRNGQGLAWHPTTGELFATEHGPTNWPWEDARQHHDELNVIVAGRNYGWPDVMGAAGEPRFEDPIITWTPALAPSGLAFYHGPYTPWQGSLLVGALRGRHLRRLVPDRTADGAWRVLHEEQFLLPDTTTRIRGVVVAPDGRAIYVTTGDRRRPDGTPDDRVYRLNLPNRPDGR